MSKNEKFVKLYQKLLGQYGDPGPWPWFGQDQPHSTDEIIIGSILTQNTNWNNVQKAINNLRKAGIHSIKDVHFLAQKNMNKLKEYIRPSGFYNQKSERLFLFAEFIFSKHNSLNQFFKLDLDQARSELLDLIGIGKETADTILLYGGNKKIFIIDSYTKRFSKHFNLSPSEPYDTLQNEFMTNIPQRLKLYQDFHALIVEWGKNHKKN